MTELRVYWIRGIKDIEPKMFRTNLIRVSSHASCNYCKSGSSHKVAFIVWEHKNSGMNRGRDRDGGVVSYFELKLIQYLSIQLWLFCENFPIQKWDYSTAIVSELIAYRIRNATIYGPYCNVIRTLFYIKKWKVKEKCVAWFCCHH